MKFVLDGDSLTIKLEGMERLWALKTRLVIPHSAVLQIDYVDERPALQDFWGYLRIPGTDIPWHFLAGTFWQRDDREFWYVRMKHDGMMTIETKPRKYSYRRIKISCDPTSAQDIVDWWHQSRKSI